MWKESIVNRKKDYRDLKRHRETCRKQHKRYYAKTAFLYETREWTSAEDDMVVAHSVPDTVLSERIQRSVGAIQKRRCMLKKEADLCNGS